MIASNNQEYSAVPVSNGQPTTFGHYICCVPANYTLWKGEKALVIDDSCAIHSTLNQTGQRIFTESFLKARSYGFLGLIPASNTDKYNFSHILTYGLTNNPDVIALQNILKKLGYFPADIPSTGNFFSVTANAVLKFQVANGILDFQNSPLTSVRVGPKTLALLNS